VRVVVGPVKQIVYAVLCGDCAEEATHNDFYLFVCIVNVFMGCKITKKSATSQIEVAIFSEKISVSNLSF